MRADAGGFETFTIDGRKAPQKTIVRRSHRRRAKRQRLVALVAILLAIVAALFVFGRINAPLTELFSGMWASLSSQERGARGASSPNDDDSVPAQTGAPDDASDSPQNNEITPEINALLLVNADNPLPKDFKQPETVPLIGKVAVRDNSVCIAKSIEAPLLQLFRDARAAGHTDLYVNSGFRSGEEQRAIYNQETDKSYVQPPGSSEHETGLAADIKIMKISGQDMVSEPSWQWLKDNAWRYGFIMRYPENKTSITGIAFEPWHFRYVGEEAAQICYEENLCLEEYLQR
jgi:D-alanyl-D-alanine carboxypeptidase